MNRLQFRVSVAPGIFQNLMESLLKGIPRVSLITAPTPDVFATCLHQVGKVPPGVPRVKFLGFSVNVAGIHPAQDKVRAICDSSGQDVITVSLLLMRKQMILPSTAWNILKVTM